MPFQDCICFQLGKLNRGINKRYRDQIAAYGLTHSQFFMLIAIYEEEGIPPSKLAQKTALDRATTTGLLDRLERDGWIERRPDPKDRRAWRIFLTPKSTKHRRAIQDIFEQTNREYLSRFSAAEWKKIQSLLNRLEP